MGQGRCILFLFACLPASLLAGALPEGRWVDLSHDFAEDTIYWPTADKFAKSTVFAGETDKGYYYSAYNLAAAEHGGTHVDAPVHFARNKLSVDKIPLEQLIGQGVVIRVADRIGKDRNYKISVADIQRWEEKHGTVPENSIVLLDTGSARFWPDPVKYMGTAERGEAAVEKLNFPGLGPDAALYLAEKRGIKAVGLDTPSIDFGGSQLFKTHRILFEHNVPALENVANLGALPDKGFTVIALPMKIRGGSGGPTRVVALVPD
ncbi:cyclase family protein [Microbulbifer hydrolyticus]|uniref:Cyclase family protein n=1 Tax=Microbulbifer hydrolyticus TaxID=48074 RepID=A0A6P1TB80_9GAMM|nr:cyclase family protein [Microbulbifer hydrolyticus]MBB5211337.1 kynurenine formamidase [Microbulbifer hydrolyticus]QHQ37902.1 cyclase family protein [Microbulbifer hydrolyticus]